MRIPPRVAAPRRSCVPGPLRSGFTLVELLVAIILIDVALLAMVAGSAVVVRRYTEVRTSTMATRAATNRLQILAGGSCAAALGSAPVARDMVEIWAAELQPNGIRELRDSVAYAVVGVPRHVVLRTRWPC